MSVQGLPFWYELNTRDTAAAQAFYGPVMGWAFRDSGMPGFTYLIATHGADMVAGLMAPETPMPDSWTLYFAVDNCDDSAARVTALGGSVLSAPADIPGTGRFAIAADPQGAVFGLMQPHDGQPSAAFHPMHAGHANWHELATPDPAAALAFYTALLNWQPGAVMEMDDTGPYQFVTAAPGDIGGIMALPTPDTPPHWMPVFGTDSVSAALARATAQGATPLVLPMEVPGGAVACTLTDPHGAPFGLVGPP
ncbi:VOC family protein [Pseudorhodobacter sp. MZDSW-24AT]|uniref:VOC family protein n=1 Tax=Pseudorhodobacter sp. MZDSW-24AT TaxID=2052957 RepID=UPI000C1EA558|nr:VOC family protein [Pseudorhodobacter sp. MZDSW-24AT]PJF08762.1 glyoxalase/bleomycin resistance/extradiol dioxygenase family protein [Pseudorhodobacter sp. MZDSW-24AT]